MIPRFTVLCALALLGSSVTSEARMVCTVVANVSSGAIVYEEGDCRTRVTPASTFKIPLAVMGFEAGILDDAHAPEFTIVAGEPAWGGEDWRKPTDPARWMKFSVVWYSQRIAGALGYDRFAELTRTFDYGNADVSGDPGKDNALQRSWIGSSLKISPVEQVGFLRRLLTGQLPVTSETVEKTKGIVESTELSGWTIHGKTGSAFPRTAEGALDRAHGWGWFVGWITDGTQTYTFARLEQDEKRERTSGGPRAKDALMHDWPQLAEQLGK